MGDTGAAANIADALPRRGRGIAVGWHARACAGGAILPARRPPGTAVASQCRNAGCHVRMSSAFTIMPMGDDVPARMPSHTGASCPVCCRQQEMARNGIHDAVNTASCTSMRRAMRQLCRLPPPLPQRPRWLHLASGSRGASSLSVAAEFSAALPPSCTVSMALLAAVLAVKVVAAAAGTGASAMQQWVAVRRLRPSRLLKERAAGVTLMELWLWLPESSPLLASSSACAV
jgi:hypothetical protein